MVSALSTILIIGTKKDISINTVLCKINEVIVTCLVMVKTRRMEMERDVETVLLCIKDNDNVNRPVIPFNVCWSLPLTRVVWLHDTVVGMNWMAQVCADKIFLCADSTKSV